MREVDGIKFAFVGEESYFAGLHTPSMFSTALDTGADVVILLAAGTTGDDLTDDDIRAVFYGSIPEGGSDGG